MPNYFTPMQEKIARKSFWFESKQFSPQNDISKLLQIAHDVTQPDFSVKIFMRQNNFAI